ncbi:hypothetical protein R1sor_018227 [Riccia sorocarpa]|uniref:Glutaredoxin domain-containing protein n=1 Tax=Riccia sorocarpa TaxID=122646 RepID=A0ABD3ICT9_9MARC
MSPPNFLDEDVSSLPSDHPFHRFEYICPPGGERRVVLYFTSLRGIPKTYNSCMQLKLLLKAFGVAIDERDVALHSGFRKELQDLLGQPLPVPRLFIKGLYVGGAEDVSRLHEEGRLASLLPEFRLARQMSWNPEYCQGCGGLRFIPCLECNGSHKVRDENDQIAVYSYRFFSCRLCDGLSTASYEISQSEAISQRPLVPPEILAIDSSLFYEEQEVYVPLYRSFEYPPVHTMLLEEEDVTQSSCRGS